MRRSPNPAANTTAADLDRYAAILDLPFGRFGLLTRDEHIAEMAFLPPDTPLRPPVTTLTTRAADTIARWLDAPAQPFDSSLMRPLSECGTRFQQRVWQALRAIPAGQVRTYGALAHALGSSARAVGQACGANPFPLAVPCHRAVAASGIGGFANATDGYLIAAKRWLLANEQAR